MNGMDRERRVGKPASARRIPTVEMHACLRCLSRACIEGTKRSNLQRLGRSSRKPVAVTLTGPGTSRNQILAWQDIFFVSRSPACAGKRKRANAGQSLVGVILHPTPCVDLSPLVLPTTMT